MSTQKPSIPKGTRDFGPEESSRRNYIMDIIKSNFKLYGFSQIETPAIENLSTLTGKYGDEGDKLLFKIINSGDYLKNVTTDDLEGGSQQMLSKISEKGLRYDLTVPFARFVVQHRNDITFPFKRFQIQPVWRADRPQKGRYREFYQCDADIVGTDSLWNEVNLTMLIQDVFRDLKYEQITIKINHRDILSKLASFVGLPGQEIPFCVAIDKLDKIGDEKVTEELIGLGADSAKIAELFEIFGKEDSSASKLEAIASILGSSRGIDELKDYFKFLKLAGGSDANVELDFSLARGLTYYTGVIFEVKANDVKIGSICGGGRYDNLTGVFGMENVSGVGISFGLDRIYDVLTEKNLFPTSVNQPVDALILHFDQESFEHGLGLLAKMRSAGITCEIYPDVIKIKKQFNYADKIGIPYTIVIGSEEIKTGKYAFKNMKSGEQQTLDINEIIQLIQND
ncbi:histidine--tRNA ligase [Marinoscillum sp. MHG1-6]|uniref:histidine--tRNA ligase n=1 Tax=Marinoscillum sp. MHG1-6 TaxID=2959627 RepID=UPI002157EA4D|nr:histidine--tRNA ligase [Marinoscillum sp. MHG1-6]